MKNIMKNKGDKCFEDLIRKQDPRFLDWSLLALDGRLTESLIREYKKYLSRYELMNIHIHQCFSDDFCREFNLEWLEGE